MGRSGVGVLFLERDRDLEVVSRVRVEKFRFFFNYSNILKNLLI